MSWDFNCKCCSCGYQWQTASPDHDFIDEKCEECDSFEYDAELTGPTYCYDVDELDKF